MRELKSRESLAVQGGRRPILIRLPGEKGTVADLALPLRFADRPSKPPGEWLWKIGP